MNSPMTVVPVTQEKLFLYTSVWIKSDRRGLHFNHSQTYNGF